MSKDCTLSDGELCTSVIKWVHNLSSTGGKAWCLRVPVDFNHDPDMLMLELVERYQKLILKIEGLEK